MVKLYESRAAGRTTIFIHVCITAFCQAVLVSLLFMEVVGTTKQDMRDKFGTLTENVGIICARFICTVILHLSQQDEVMQGLELMKYALNHRYSFLDYKKAFLMGFLQSFLTLGVETVNLLVILQSNTT